MGLLTMLIPVKLDRTFVRSKIVEKNFFRWNYPKKLNKDTKQLLFCIFNTSYYISVTISSCITHLQYNKSIKTKKEELIYRRLKSAKVTDSVLIAC